MGTRGHTGLAGSLGLGGAGRDLQGRKFPFCLVKIGAGPIAHPGRDERGTAVRLSRPRRRGGLRGDPAQELAAEKLQSLANA